MYQVYYDGQYGKSYAYCMYDMDLETASRMLDLWKITYLNDAGGGRMHPNGKGYYPFSNPRIEKV